MSETLKALAAIGVCGAILVGACTQFGSPIQTSKSNTNNRRIEERISNDNNADSVKLVENIPIPAPVNYAPINDHLYEKKTSRDIESYNCRGILRKGSFTSENNSINENYISKSRGYVRGNQMKENRETRTYRGIFRKSYKSHSDSSEKNFKRPISSSDLEFE